MDRPDPDYEVYARNTRPKGPMISHGAGARVFDVNGRSYIDCCAQTLNLNLGHCHDHVTREVVRQAQQLTFASSRFGCDVVMRLHEKLAQITPPGLCRVNLKNTSGSSANECAVKVARKRSGKRTILSFMHSHHGQTAEMMRISGKHFDVPYLGERHAAFMPLPSAELDDGGELSDAQLDWLWELHEGDVAAVIVEPVMVDAGVVILSRGYLQRLRDFCDRKDITLIFDEIQTGFGWLGDMHAMDLFGVEPDVVTFGKGLGAGFPLAAAVMTADHDVLNYGEHELTYGAHPVSCAASLAMIEILEGEGFLESVRGKSRRIAERMEALTGIVPAMREARGLGLIWGIELEDHPSLKGSDLVAALLEAGIIMRTSKVGANSNVLQYKPPLVISESEIDESFDRIGSVLVRRTSAKRRRAAPTDIPAVVATERTG